MNQPPPTDDGMVFQELWGNIAIANDRDESVTLRVRRLRPTAFMDCDFVAQNPTDSLSRDLFGPAEFWEVDPGRAFGLESWREWEDSGDCDAFLIDGAGLTMQLLFLDLDTYPWTTMGSTVDTVDPERTLVIEPEALNVAPFHLDLVGNVALGNQFHRLVDALGDNVDAGDPAPGPPGDLYRAVAPLAARVENVGLPGVGAEQRV